MRRGILLLAALGVLIVAGVFVFGFGSTQIPESIGLGDDAGGEGSGELAAGIEASEIRTVLPRDAIPAITEPKFVTASKAPWGDEDRVMGIEIDGEAKAYPVPILSWHEIVNDEVGGVPVAVTYCPLCGSGIVFDRRHDGEELTFGVSGKLYRNDLVMYDHQSQSLWTQILGTAIRGARVGEELKSLPVAQVTWAEWKKMYPRTKVLSDDTGFPRNYSTDPYLGYASSTEIGIFGDTEADPRLEAKELIVGVVISKDALAFPVNALNRKAVVQSEASGVPVVVAYDSDSTLATAFDRRVDGVALDFENTGDGTMRDKQTDSDWSSASGKAVTGKMKGQQLVQLTATQAFWFAWSDFHQKTRIVE